MSYDTSFETKVKLVFYVEFNDHRWLHSAQKLRQNFVYHKLVKESKVMMSLSHLQCALIAAKHVTSFCSIKLQI